MSETVDVVVTTTEINALHGTGPLVQRIFKGRRNVFSIRSRDQWGGHNFGDWNVAISQTGKSRSEAFSQVLCALDGHRVSSVLCVPYFIDELVTSIAASDAFDTPLCAYLMDDQNVAAELIPDAVMREFLEKSSLRLATHPELRAAYQRKYGLPFFLLPAVVPDELIARRPVEAVCGSETRRGALLGSFWDQSWFDRLCAALRGCSCRIDWYGNNRTPFLKFPAEDLDRAGITAFGLIPEKQLTEELRKYPFVIVPVGALDGGEGNSGVASLSLPGRILFAAATSHTPILVVGSPQTCAARFVKHFGIGETVPYATAELAAAIDRFNDPGVQREMRSRAAAIGPAFSDLGVGEWLMASLARGCPIDTRFEDAFAGYAERP